MGYFDMFRCAPCSARKKERMDYDRLKNKEKKNKCFKFNQWLIKEAPGKKGNLETFDGKCIKDVTFLSVTQNVTFTKDSPPTRVHDGLNFEKNNKLYFVRLSDIWSISIIEQPEMSFLEKVLDYFFENFPKKIISRTKND